MSESSLMTATSDHPAERSDNIVEDDADFVKLFVGQVGPKNAI